MWKIPTFTWRSEFRQNYYRTSFSPTVPPFAARISRIVADGGTWRLKWERLKTGESNGKLPPRTCQGCSVPEPYRSHDWALAPAKPGLQGWILMNEWITWESPVVTSVIMFGHYKHIYELSMKYKSVYIIRSHVDLSSHNTSYTHYTLLDSLC